MQTCDLSGMRWITILIVIVVAVVATSQVANAAVDQAGETECFPEHMPSRKKIWRNNMFWQTERIKILYLFSAYSDTREDQHYIRVLGMVDTRKYVPHRSTRRIVCVTSCADETFNMDIVVPKVMWRKNDAKTLKPVRYRAYVLSCPVPKDCRPEMVSLTFDTCLPLTNALKVRTPTSRYTRIAPPGHPEIVCQAAKANEAHVAPETKPDRNKGDAAQTDTCANAFSSGGKAKRSVMTFGVCVKPMNYPNEARFTALRLAEWIELQLAQGAEFIYTYVYNVTDDMLKVLQTYWRKGVLDFKRVSFPGSLSNDVKKRSKEINSQSMQVRHTEVLVK